MDVPTRRIPRGLSSIALAPQSFPPNKPQENGRPGRQIPRRRQNDTVVRSLQQVQSQMRFQLIHLLSSPQWQIQTVFPPLWKNCRTPPHTKTLSDADGTFRRPLRLKLLVDTILTVSLFPVKPHRSTIKLLQTSARSGLHRAKSTQGADITSTGAARSGNCIPVMWRQFPMKQTLARRCTGQLLPHLAAEAPAEGVSSEWLEAIADTVLLHIALTH